MVQLIAGEKGEGKTKKLLDMTNHSAKTASGSIVFIDDDRRHMFDLHHDIRFVETGKYFLSDAREFAGYLLGMMVMDNDIEHIYVDGLTNIINNFNRTVATFNDDLKELSQRLLKFSEDNSVDFTITINCDRKTLPEEVKSLLI